MNEDNKERPFSKLVLEIGPLIIFFLCYYKAPIPENIVNDIDAANLFKIIFATKIFVPAILIALMNNIGNDAATAHMFFGAIPSPFFAIDIIFMFLVVQQIEGNLITPALVGKSVGLHPMLVMIVLLIGGTLLGPLGMLFAVPATGVIKVILIEIAFLRKNAHLL